MDWLPAPQTNKLIHKLKFIHSFVVCSARFGQRTAPPFHSLSQMKQRQSTIPAKQVAFIIDLPSFVFTHSIHYELALICCLVCFFFAEHCGVPPPLTHNSSTNTNQPNQPYSAAASSSLSVHQIKSTHQSN